MSFLLIAFCQLNAKISVFVICVEAIIYYCYYKICTTVPLISSFIILQDKLIRTNPAGNYMFKVNNRNTRARCEICSKLTIKIPERCQWHRCGVFIINFEHISHLVLMFLLSTLSRYMLAGKRFIRHRFYFPLIKKAWFHTNILFRIPFV